VNDAGDARPGWVSDELFPFTSRFIDLDGNHVHYVDEGTGPVLLMLHGNPAWSFLYRHLITGLRPSFRCIALDYPGFGLSTARDGYPFRPADHARVVEAFADALGLEQITFVVNDWGGPIGLWVAGRRPERVAGLVITNTFAWPVTGDRHFEVFSYLMGGQLRGVLTQRLNMFVNVLVPRGHPQHPLGPAEMAHYRAPFPTARSRRPVAILPREITAGAGWLAEVEHGLARLQGKPVLIIWGEKDFAFRASERRRFQNIFPGATTISVGAAGHFMADDAPEAMIKAILDWARPEPR
jgi:haloalkane dehalogenase